MQISAVAILENPRAGKGRAGHIASWLENELHKRNIPSVVYNNTWPDDFTGFSDIWLIGGDGTINYFINRYPNCDKALALFKGGTGNDFAWKLYGDQTDTEQLSQVLNASPKPVDAGKCNEWLFINCLGLDFDGQILESMNAIRILGGHLGYLLAVIAKIFSFREQKFVINTGNETWNEKMLLLSIVNSSRVGGGFFISPHAEINDGKLDMVFCKCLPVWKRLRYLPVMKKGKHLHLPFITHRTGESFHISCEKETPLQIDGELRTARNLDVTVLTGRFLFRY